MGKLDDSEVNLNTEVNNIIVTKKVKNNSRITNKINFVNSSSTSKINKKKCPCCLKNIEGHKQIAQQCEICFEITMKIFHFVSIMMKKNVFNVKMIIY